MRHRMWVWLLLLTLSVTPTVGTPPTTLAIKVRHPFEQGDRFLQIGVFCGADLLTESDRALDPRNAPIYTLHYTAREACELKVVVRVVKWDNSSTSQARTVLIRD